MTNLHKHRPTTLSKNLAGVLASAVVASLCSLGCGEQAPTTHTDVVEHASAVERAPEGIDQVAARLRGAERIVAGTVEDTHARFQTNEYGDRLIMTTVRLRVDDVLRGASSDGVSFVVEGGTVGDLTLQVSDLPVVQAGDRGVFALRRSLDGATWVPNGRSAGLIVTSGAFDIETLREAERMSR